MLLLSQYGTTHSLFGGFAIGNTVRCTHGADAEVGEKVSISLGGLASLIGGGSHSLGVLVPLRPAVTAIAELFRRLIGAANEAKG